MEMPRRRSKSLPRGICPPARIRGVGAKGPSPADGALPPQLMTDWQRPSVGSQKPEQHSDGAAQVAAMGLHTGPASGVPPSAAGAEVTQVPLSEHCPLQQSAFAVQERPVPTHAAAQAKPPPAFGAQMPLQHWSAMRQS